MTSSVLPGGRCPCFSGDSYPECCNRYHRGDALAPTAEQLMRSRYSAFAVGDATYLLETWHPRTRPESLELDAGVVWTRLVIERTNAGGPFDHEGLVEFTAHYRGDGGRGRQHETSRFERVDRVWYYVDGVD